MKSKLQGRDWTLEPWDERLQVRIDGQKSSQEIAGEIAEESPVVMLAFSTGKDAICSWLALRDRVEVRPFYAYLIPDLEFVEDSLAYYEKFFGTRIARVPHPSLYRWINEMVFVPPERCAIVEELALPTFEFADIYRGLREDWGLEDGALAATGVRAADSPVRRIHFSRTGGVNWRSRVAYPIWDWRSAKLGEEMKRAGVKLPVDYRIFGRSFDGMDYRFLKPIKENFPRDFERILEWFPLAEAEIYRGERL